MKTIKSYTDLEQSKKMAEILPIESADHHYVRKVTDFMGKPVDGKWSHPKYGNPNSKYANYIVQNFTSYEKLPCWSLAALLAIYPMALVMDFSGKYAAVSISSPMSFADNPIDAVYEIIIWLNENNNKP